MPIANRKTFNHYVIGNSVFLTLDSGYLYPYNGTQVEFINNISLTYPNYAKYAVYHVRNKIYKNKFFNFISLF